MPAVAMSHRRQQHEALVRGGIAPEVDRRRERTVGNSSSDSIGVKMNARAAAVGRGLPKITM